VRTGDFLAVSVDCALAFKQKEISMAESIVFCISIICVLTSIIAPKIKKLSEP
jgi:hypothetical protein